MGDYSANRVLMKSAFGRLKRTESDQASGVPQPPLQKAVPEGAQILDLPEHTAAIVRTREIDVLIERRRSRRSFTADKLSQQELSFLLWATQKVQRVIGDNYATLRAVPSGGARHPFETYLVVNRVEGLKAGLYRYLPLTHQLVLLDADPERPARSAVACCSQEFIGESAVTFMWTCIPYRGEWRYGEAAHKTMVLDAGHLCQNLYLACEAIGCGTCAVGAFNQLAVDTFLGVDGNEEFAIYVAPVGRAGGPEE